MAWAEEEKKYEEVKRSAREVVKSEAARFRETIHPKGLMCPLEWKGSFRTSSRMSR